MLTLNFTQRFFMVNWVANTHLFSPNISLGLFSKKTIFTILNSVSLPKLSYKNSFLFIFLSCCVGNTYCQELTNDYKENIRNFDERKQKELDSSRGFYEEQQNSVAHKTRAEPPPKKEQKSSMSELYDFVIKHYFFSAFIFFVLLKPISHFFWLVLSLCKKQLNAWFNLLPKSFRRFLHKERRRFQELWDYIMQNKDGIL